MKAVILAAGVGSRFRKQLPKSLIRLPVGYTIIANQIAMLRNTGVNEIIVVIGFKKELIMEEISDVLFRYNPIYHITNTSQSLRMAFESTEHDDVIWLNGDVYLDDTVISRIFNASGNTIAVNKSKCGEEEVKYKTDSNGRIVEISKKVQDAEGEAVGVNKISKADFGTFVKCLQECSENDYFEMGIEFAIKKGIVFKPVDISDCTCIEIDFKKDLEQLEKELQI